MLNGRFETQQRIMIAIIARCFAGVYSETDFSIVCCAPTVLGSPEVAP